MSDVKWHSTKLTTSLRLVLRSGMRVSCSSRPLCTIRAQNLRKDNSAYCGWAVDGFPYSYGPEFEFRPEFLVANAYSRPWPLPYSFFPRHNLHYATQQILHTVWDFKFSRRRVWSSESSGMYCRVLNWMSTYVSEMRAASIIRAMMEAALTSETSVDIRFSVSVWVGWAYKATHAPRPIYDILCVTICFIPPVVPYLWQTTVSYTTESHHSRLAPCKYALFKKTVVK
jgi:hypothetical protein